ncbi:MAG: 2-succinyl-5-enolpyruvyl-6-hydroxy-3-cyclohexene-1-carboxylic-acid synthase, partial [Burkholderiales bacterium]|nr:2-succinyl-5-enolpyruvyl-6-hydroxy-3-cyclohexene-1-carboxylic-acid synthase [Burkholderiales bacterium]
MSDTIGRIVLAVNAADPASVRPTASAGSQADVQATMCATLVDQWVRDGVRHALIAPGSRSTPMALALAAQPDLRIDVYHDERSASFAALGSAIATGVPALLLCTSGTAAAHFHAAVVEAHLAHVPMLVLTADRPPELRDIGAPQTIDQTQLYGNAVRWFHDPGVPAQAAASTWRSLARHAFERTLGMNAGPVHLNLPFREPLVGTAGDLPGQQLAPVLVPSPALRYGTLALAVERERGVIVAGYGIDDPAAVATLGAVTGWPILADPRSGCRGLPGAISTVDALLRHEEFAIAHRPDVVLHLGEPPASKVLGQWLTEAR